jgi:hypothetical protein
MSELTEKMRNAGGDGDAIHCWNIAAKGADRIEHLERVLFQVRRCAYPVSTEIDPRGYRWSEAYLDQAIAAIDEALK